MSDRGFSSETHTRAMAAKEFIISEVVKQAEIENIPLSELERKMLYFTEGPGAPADIFDTNAQFDEQYDTPTYEKKISTLIRDARKRAKEESPDSERRWKESIADLSKEDHYILIMVSDRADAAARSRPPYDQLKLFATALVVVGALFPVVTLMEKYNIHLPNRWVLELLVAVFYGAFLFLKSRFTKSK